MRFFLKVLIFITACNEKCQPLSSYPPSFLKSCVNDYVFQSFKKNLIVISQHR